MNPPATFEVSVKASDGVASTFTVFGPHAATPRTSPVLLCLPAMGTAAGYYRPFAAKLAVLSGCAVALADLRGQGSSSARARRGAQFGYRHILEDDLPRVIGAIAQIFPRSPLFIVGHSLGGQFGALLASQRGLRVAGLVLVASGTAHFRAWPRALRLRSFLLMQAARLIARVLPWYPGTALGFGGDQPRLFMRDWGHNVTTGRYEPAGGSIHYESAMELARLPVLSVRIPGDPIAPEGANEELLGKLMSASIERRVAAGVPSDAPRRRHFSWARQPDEIAGLINDWLERVAAANAGALRRGHDEPEKESRADVRGEPAGPGHEQSPAWMPWRLSAGATIAAGGESCSNG